MPRPQHEQANPEVQEFFKEIVVEQIDAIAAAHPEEQIHTYFQDEARFGQKGTITRVWARRGSRPRAVRQTGFTSLYVLAAVCAATGAMSAVIMPTLNTEVVNLFLEQFSRELPAGVHAVLIWDGAGFHTGEDVVVPSNVSLIQLPPYSPELNPVENLWHYLPMSRKAKQNRREVPCPQLPDFQQPTVSLVERLLGEESRSIELAFQGRSQLGILGAELRPEVVPIFGNDVVQCSNGMKTHGACDSSEVTWTEPGPCHTFATAPSGVKPMTNCRSKAASVSIRLPGLSPVFLGCSPRIKLWRVVMTGSSVSLS